MNTTNKGYARAWKVIYEHLNKTDKDLPAECLGTMAAISLLDERLTAKQRDGFLKALMRDVLGSKRKRLLK